MSSSPEPLVLDNNNIEEVEDVIYHNMDIDGFPDHEQVKALEMQQEVVMIDINIER